MEDNIRPAAAVEILCAALGCSPSQGRKSLIAGLAHGEIAAWAKSYWRMATIGGHAFHPGGEQASDQMVPVDFWRQGHSRHHNLGPDSGTTKLPAGSCGDFKIGRFRTAFAMTAAECAARFPNWWRLEEFGDEPAWLVWEAIDLTVDKDEVRNLAEQEDFLATVDGFWTPPRRRSGPASPDQVQRWRAVAILMARQAPAECFHSKETISRWLGDIATRVCADGLDTTTISRLAKFMAKEAPKYVESTDTPID
jgi:hypothetical protein